MSGVLRRLHLLDVAEAMRLPLEIHRRRRENMAFRQQHADFDVPPAALAYDAYGHLSWTYYMKSGVDHARFFCDLIARHHQGDAVSVCEWGCGPGRIIRHLPALLDYPVQRIVGTDYNRRTIRWCRNHIKHVEFFENRLQPPLPFADHEFDCLYCLSVFTHLSGPMHDAWISELSRVVKPGGLIMLTTQGDHYRSILEPNELQRYDQGQLVVRGGSREGKKTFSAFHPQRYMQENLLRDFDVIEHIPAPVASGLFQDVWIIRSR